MPPHEPPSSPGRVARVTVAAGHVVMRFAGQFDATSSHLILDTGTTYLRPTTTHLTVDLSRASLIESSTVGALVRLWRLARPRSVTVDVVVGSATDETILGLAALRELLTVTVAPPA